MEDMTEFMGNHALQFIAAELADRPSGYPNHRILRRQAGGKRVDPDIIEHIHRRHRGARGQSHFLDHIE